MVHCLGDTLERRNSVTDEGTQKDDGPFFSLHFFGEEKKTPPKQKKKSLSPHRANKWWLWVVKGGIRTVW
ncbi:Protein CBG25868 [Caenorhabditis briggsae]|uniref:Protein CBG25868 n=1 Tax=Caenorhabditis briggsae TaxID=6238 RepID=B6IIU5_CAEBR|nr:Protein CBG25868 [Caenorhabditis briggsae]CAR99825.1 Protein CBG25868 [Caenorhabditis briggsae]